MVALKNFRVDSFVSGLAVKAPVLVATDGPITLEGIQTVNSRALVAGDRCLVKDQADPIENGVYNVESSAWQRAGDMDGNRDIVGGTVVPTYRVSDGVFVYWIIAGDGVALEPDVDALNFSIYYDPAAGAGVVLPVSTVELSSLAADNAGGWIEVTGVRVQDATDSLYLDGNLIITDGGSGNPTLQVTASGGDHFTLVTTNGYYVDFNPTVRFDSPELYMLEKAAAGADLVGYGQWWVRSSDDAPMYTTEAGVDSVLNSAPSFAAPVVLLDDEELQFGTGTDLIMDWDSAAGEFHVTPVAADSVFDFKLSQILRLGNFGIGHVDIQNQGILALNLLVISKSGGTSSVSYEVGAWNHNDNRLIRPLLDDYAIKHVTAGSVAGVMDIDFEDGNSHFLTLTENVSTMTISNPPATGRLGIIYLEILQDNPARTIAWAASITWPGGTPPNLTVVGATYLVDLRTRDAGTGYLGTFYEDFS
jgi:hypothetical protein